MTEIEKELKRFIASGKATKKDYSGGFLTTYIDPLKVAKHFAEWQREQMMKDAVEGQVERGYCEDGISEHFEVFAYLSGRDERFKDLSDGQSVKVIIIKE